MISEANDSSKLYSSDYEVKKGVNSLCISLDKDVALRGDIRVDFYNKPNKKIKKKVRCHVSILFIDNNSDLMFY